MQIDGNFGATAAMAEMLLQSGDGTIGPPPRPPQGVADRLGQGPAGAGRLRGGPCLEETASSTSSTIRSRKGGKARVRYADQTQSIDLKPRGTKRIEF